MPIDRPGLLEQRIIATQQKEEINKCPTATPTQVVGESTLQKWMKSKNNVNAMPELPNLKVY